MLVIKNHYFISFQRAIIACLIAVTFGITLLVGLVPSQNSFAQDFGDTNGDGVVDEQDTGAVPGDTNGDGVVDEQDTEETTTGTTTDDTTGTATAQKAPTTATGLEDLISPDQKAPTAINKKVVCNPAEKLLVKNSSGNTVTILQTILTGIGYDTKGVDGKFGPNTEKAVIQFQEKNDLVKDGKVGKNTWAKLCALYNNTSKGTNLSQYGGLLICKDCGKVNMNGISDKMIKIFPDISAIYIKHTGLTGEITSAIRSADGKSLHDQGLAIDLRTKHLSNDVVKVIVKDLRSLFDKDYDIVDEHNKPIKGVTQGPHIHIEYDPPK